ncbi:MULTISPECIES: S66 family peptidase [Pseudoalteromonas]|uniref:S66 family peptidase n=1 Tax=Pseudoalteromonas TaxID=53246 RepID=UPI000AAC053A|nr:MULTISPECIES: S66 peptidase family protein [Pseudoalteromonas]
MDRIVYPTALKAGSKIAVTAFSAGVSEAFHPRLELSLAYLRDSGFEVISGECLKENNQHVSASAQHRAQELMTFLCDDSIDGIAPPWGGEFAMEVLPLLDFERLKTAKPKWLFGFSDISTVAVALTSRLGWSTAHCANLMQLIGNESEALTAATIPHLMHAQRGYDFTQRASSHYQLHGKSFADNPHTVLNATQPNAWKTTSYSNQATIRGRLIGGCLDTLQHLLGSEYCDLSVLQHRYGDDGIVLYLENAELTPTALKRALLGLKFKGGFSQINGLLIGRNAQMEQGVKDISSQQALLDVVSELSIPVIYDMDIGHLPPNLTLFNGAMAQVSLDNGIGSVRQWLS